MLKHLLCLFVVTVMVTSATYLRPARDAGEGDKDCNKRCKGKPLELSFVVDGSASIWQDNFTYALDFIEDFVDGFDISPSVVRVSMVTFGEVAYAQDAFGFADYTTKQALKEAISRVPYRSGIKTNTSGGIRYMLRHQMSEARQNVPDLRKVVVVMTDGNSQEGRLTKQAADDANAAGLEVFAIGVGQNVSEQELHNIASDDKHVFVVSSYNMLQSIKDRLKYKTCGNIPNPPCQMDPLDLSFVIDSSASIGEGNFSIGMKFVKDFVDFFQIDPTVVRVSAVTFGYGLYTEDAFDFDTYESKKAVMDRLTGLEWRHGKATHTWEGIAYMRDIQMSKARPKAAHVCIVITDGESQEPEITAAEARQAQDRGIVMYAVGVGEVGKQLNEEELINIAGDPGRVLTATSYAQLNLLKDRLAKITCEGVVFALSQKGQRPLWA